MVRGFAPLYITFANNIMETAAMHAASSLAAKTRLSLVLERG